MFFWLEIWFFLWISGIRNSHRFDTHFSIFWTPWKFPTSFFWKISKIWSWNGRVFQKNMEMLIKKFQFPLFFKTGPKLFFSSKQHFSWIHQWVSKVFSWKKDISHWKRRFPKNPVEGLNSMHIFFFVWPSSEFLVFFCVSQAWRSMLPVKFVDFYGASKIFGILSRNLFFSFAQKLSKKKPHMNADCSMISKKTLLECSKVSQKVYLNARSQKEKPYMNAQNLRNNAPKSVLECSRHGKVRLW